jgi:Ca2+-binding RTX toxin-like protein
VGSDTSCAILIVINSDGSKSVLVDASQGPYDGSDDTLAALQNDSSSAVSSIDLSSSTQDIFGFEGDGICTVTPQPSGCPFGPTGYEGPNNSYSNISSDAHSGRVNFTTAVPPGGSAYFGLEETLTASDISVGALNGGTVAQNPYKPYGPYAQGDKCHGKAATIVGTAKGDTITGTKHRDVITTGAGNDIVRGLGANDLICTGSGKDISFGGGGNDKEYGGGANDRLVGSPGKDGLVGDAGNDTLLGGGGNDKEFGKNGNDKLFGSTGNDSLFGNKGSDTLVCGTGTDLGRGGAGQDVEQSCRLHAIG